MKWQSKPYPNSAFLAPNLNLLYFFMESCILKNLRMFLKNVSITAQKGIFGITHLRYFWFQIWNNWFLSFARNTAFWKIRDCWFQIWHSFLQFPRKCSQIKHFQCKTWSFFCCMKLWMSLMLFTKTQARKLIFVYFVSKILFYGSCKL